MSDPLFAVVFDRPEPGRCYAYGPFAGFDLAAKFAAFVEAEINPARVIPWAEAVALPGVRVADPVAELLTWRESVALPQAGAPKPFRNCFTDNAYRASLTASPERPCDRIQPHPAHKHVAQRASWQCPGVADAATPTSEEPQL